jgi:hypothetical protein
MKLAGPARGPKDKTVTGSLHRMERKERFHPKRFAFVCTMR